MAQPPQQPPQPLPGQAAVVPAGPQLVVIPAIPAGGLPVIPPLPGDTVKTVGADKKPKFDRNAPVHRHDLSLCLTNMTQSEVCFIPKTPCNSTCFRIANIHNPRRNQINMERVK